MNLKQFFILCNLFVFALVTQAEIYKWRDDNGKVHFSAAKPEDGKVIKTITPEDYIPPPSATTTTHAPIEIYITQWCPYCKKAMALFKKEHIEFVSYDIESDSAAAKRKTKLDTKCQGVPVTVIDNTNILCGFDERQYKDALMNR